MSEPALDLLEQCEYPAGFFLWLRNNQPIWREFERRALSMARAGKKRYSARTIIEVTRWHTDLHDTDGVLKINDHHTPGLARWWMKKHGKDYPGFFLLRDSLGRDISPATTEGERR